VVQPQVSWTNKAVTFNWASRPGLTYQVQFKNTLSEPAWQTLDSNIVATGTTASGSDAAFDDVPQRFYRIYWVR
jgi:hypothetical protein